MTTSEEWEKVIGELLDEDIQSIQTLKQRGGQSVLRTQAGEQKYIAKCARGTDDIRMLEGELHGLNTLAESDTVHIPRIISSAAPDSNYFLFVMECVEEGGGSKDKWEQFARELAELHRCSSKKYGLERDNYIGQMPQSNNRHTKWTTFYVEERLLPEMRWARERGLHDRKDEQMLKMLCRELPDICPEEPPALTHGDMWSGNILPSVDRQIYLIDPAVSYAHREMDIGMSLLFGGVPAAFYRAYHTSWPMEDDWEDRMDVYQLYYLLVHVNMFGRSYVGQVRKILSKYS